MCWGGASAEARSSGRRGLGQFIFHAFFPSEPPRPRRPQDPQPTGPRSSPWHGAQSFISCLVAPSHIFRKKSPLLPCLVQQPPECGSRTPRDSQGRVFPSQARKLRHREPHASLWQRQRARSGALAHQLVDWLTCDFHLHGADPVSSPLSPLTTYRAERTGRSSFTPKQGGGRSPGWGCWRKHRAWGREVGPTGTGPRGRAGPLRSGNPKPLPTTPPPSISQLAPPLVRCIPCILTLHTPTMPCVGEGSWRVRVCGGSRGLGGHRGLKNHGW